MQRSSVSLVLTSYVAVSSLALGTGCPPPPPPPPAATFVNFESPPVRPLDLTPDGTTLLVANTADDRIEIFDVTGAVPVHVGQIPVGLDPVAVHARTNGEAWVVNQISDSVSVVDLAARNVVRTIVVGDEPSDVVFAGNPERAFVSVSQENAIKVYDPASPSAAPLVVPVEGEDPRALATDGVRVYAAIFESGNRSTILGREAVSDAGGPYGGLNPPPNSGAGFDPPIAPGLPPPPPAGLVVRKNALGQWVDVNGADWSPEVSWDLHDHDVAILPAANPTAVAYATGLMNLNMALAVTHDGRVAVVGTDAMNEIRFEPNVKGIFTRVIGAVFDPLAPGAVQRADLNPHLTYLVRNIPQNERDLALGDPRGIAWSSTVDRAYVSGMGSNNLIVTNSLGVRLGRIEVGQGPTGLVWDEASDRLFVLNRFDATLTTIDTTTDTEILPRVGFYDPTPQVIRNGRPLLYSTHEFSGLGQIACGSCHVDGRMDQVAWDLGDPQGAMKAMNQNCDLNPCPDWHPMKGPMTTQTLTGIVGTEPFHWRGDREDLAAFAPAFVGLQGDDVQPTAAQMQAMTDFVATLRYPPNPFREFDGSVKNEVFPNGGNPSVGEALFTGPNLDGNRTCNTCHALPTGTNTFINGPRTSEVQSFKVAQLRNAYEKTGFDTSSSSNNRGFAFLHDGSIESVFEFLQNPVFNGILPGPAGDQQRRDLEAFVFSLGTDTHAAVGAQVTVDATNKTDPQVLQLLNGMINLANGGQIGMVVKGVVAGLQRGAYYAGSGNFQLDRAAELLTSNQLLALAGTGSELTATAVVAGTEVRIGVDRDEDGKFDRDEIDAGTDPADPNS